MTLCGLALLALFWQAWFNAAVFGGILRTPWSLWLEYAGNLWMLCFATLLARRLPESAEARILSLLLILNSAGISLYNSARIAVWVFDAVLYGFALPMLAVYAMRFAHPPDMARRLLAVLSYICAAAVTMHTILYYSMTWANSHADGPAMNVLVVLEALLPAGCAMATVPATRGSERARFVWSALPVCFLYMMYVVFHVLQFFPQLATGAGLDIVYVVTRVSIFLMPLGMTYALLNRRLLDIGFVLNRAAIFSGVSLILVGVFVLVEWLLSGWLQNASHSASLAISAVLALALGLSIRFVHARVEHVVDNVFFRKRRQDEEAIRTTAVEASFITEKSVLLARTEDVLAKHADAASVAILLDDGAGSYGGVSENDPALVTLRTRHATLDLHSVETAIHGEFAYPMVARGRLVGALVLGPKRSGESYTPDESHAIAQLAHSVAGALDVLLMKKESEHDDVLEAIRALPQRLVEALEMREHAQQ